MNSPTYGRVNARQSKKEVVMGDRLSGAIITAAVAAAAISTVVETPITQAFAQTPAASGAVPKTSWGEPDLQGIWTDEFDTALQRPAQLANQEFFTEAQRAELDKTRSATLNRFATEREINGAYNRVTADVDVGATATPPGGAWDKVVSDGGGQ